MQDDLLQLSELDPVFPLLYPDDTSYAHISAKEQMGTIDANKDGKLSLSELENARHTLYHAVDPDPHNLYYIKSMERDEL